VALFGRVCARCGAAVPQGDLVERVIERGPVRTVAVLCMPCAWYCEERWSARACAREGTRMGERLGPEIRGMLYVVEMPDGSRWGVPVAVIAAHRAAEYASEFGGDVGRSLDEDTWPVFEADSYDVHDWASGNMNWADVADAAIRLPDQAAPVDYQEGWVNGAYSFAGKP
jgi:hypothetical protein